MDAEILRRAGVPDADAVVVSTDGDNTNLVIAQVVEKRWAVPCVVVRVLDPARADFYAARGMRTICPTQTAISALATAVRKEAPAPEEAKA
jgi:trk system potassium uptake protein TrkA